MSPRSTDEGRMISVVITDRRKDQDRINLQARMLDAVGDSVIAVDIDQKILYWNDAATKIYGWMPDEVMGHDFVKIILKDIPERVILDIETRLRKGRAWFGDLVVHHREGFTFPVYASFNPIFDDDGRFIAYIGVSHDITGSKRSEQELRERERIAQGILTAVKESIWLFSLEGTILKTNPTALERLGGRDIGEVIGHHFSDFMTQEQAQKHRDRLDDVISSRQSIDFLDEWNGIVFNHTFYPIFGDRGSVQNIVVFSRDITDLNRTEAELKKSEERLRSILDNSRDVIYQMNMDTGRYEYISPSVMQVIGFSPGELLAMDREALLSRIHPEDLPVVQKTMFCREDAFEGDVEYRHLTREGDYRWLSNHISPDRGLLRPSYIPNR